MQCANTESKSFNDEQVNFFDVHKKPVLNDDEILEWIKLQFKKFNEMTDTVLSFTSLPVIEKVFIHYNTHMSSSAAAERLFSIAGYILSPKRSKLNDKLFNKIMVLKANKYHA